MEGEQPVARAYGTDSGPVPWCRDSGERGTAFLESLGSVDRLVHNPRWASGDITLTLVLTDERPPDDLVVSVRCVVTTSDEVLVCQTPNGPHLIPGGRRELGETWEETARREVQEETGYEVGLLTPLAIVLLHRNGGRPQDAQFTFPHPDAFWVIYFAPPTSRPSDGWVDTEGWEIGSAMVPIAEAARLDLTPIDHAMLRVLPERG